MKTNIYLYLFLLLISVFAASCDDEEQQPPQSAAGFTASATTMKVGEEVQFSNTSENATAFRWSFGDGTTSKEISPKKSYESSGKFLVSLVSTGAGGSTISNLEITVTPNASFAVEGEDNLVALTPIQFTNTSKGATSYKWTFGNAANSTSTEENPTFSYLTAGTYTVTLTATSTFGETQYSKEITVAAAAPEVYFVEYNAGMIRKLALDGSETVSNMLDITGKGGVGIAYDHVNGKIYFSDFEVVGEGKIWRVNLDGSDLQPIVTGLIEPYGIALDVTGGKVYWADERDEEGDYIGHISRANLDGSNREDLVSMEDAQFRAVALDVENNKMYFYEVYNEDLYVADLNGSNATPIVSGVYGYAIAVDTESDKIYFDDQNDEQLKRANLDGTGVEMVDDTATRIYGIVVDNEDDKLYWSGTDSEEIYVSNLDGSDQVTLKSGLESPRGIFLRK
jgi:PKD repeat protein